MSYSSKGDPLMRVWDYVIVGAGAAGCALAHELAKSGEVSVLLLESGAGNASPYIKVPALNIIGISRFDWGYVSEADPSRAGRSERWVRGHALGGSTSVNGMIFVRGAKSDYDRWASLGNVGWSYLDVLPLFIEMERFGQGGAGRGVDGPLSVNAVTQPHPLTEAFLGAAQVAGIPRNPDYNVGSQEGVSLLQLTQRKGLRCSAADAFINPLRGKPNFRLMLNTRVERVLVEGNRATGVVIRRDNESRLVHGRKIVLSAGAINTPKLLMHSGIGEPEELLRHNIDVRVASPEVGRNLREHPLLRIIYKSRVGSNNLTGGWPQKLRLGWQFLAHRQGPLASPIEAVGFLKSIPELEHPDIQVHFMPIGALCPADNPVSLLATPSVTIFMNKSHSLSRGRVRLASGDPTAAPRIEPRLFDDPRDLETMVQGVQTVRRIVQSPPLCDLLYEEVAPGGNLTSDEALRDHIRRHTELAYHPVGTCRMGIDADAVVGPDLAVRGADNLYVADASIMPDLTSGNTAAASMMIGVKLGKQLNKLRPSARDAA